MKPTYTPIPEVLANAEYIRLVSGATGALDRSQFWDAHRRIVSILERIPSVNTDPVGEQKMIDRYCRNAVRAFPNRKELLVALFLSRGASMRSMPETCLEVTGNRIF